MNPSGLIIALSTTLGIALFGAGVYMTITNFTAQLPLFNGIVLFTFGVTILLLVTIASAIGRALMTFNAIYAQQIDMSIKINNELNRRTAENRMPPGFGTMFRGMNPKDITITDMTTGEPISPVDGDIVKGVNDIIKNMIKGGAGKGGKNLMDMNVTELEDELSKSIKKDDFEKAAVIKKLIEDIENPPGSPDNPEINPSPPDAPTGDK